MPVAEPWRSHGSRDLPVELLVVRWKTTRGTPSREHVIDQQRLYPHDGRALTFCGRPVAPAARVNRLYVNAMHNHRIQDDACDLCGMTRKEMIEAPRMPLCLAVVGCTICREQLLIREATKARLDQQREHYAYYLKMAPWTPNWTSAIVNYP